MTIDLTSQQEKILGFFFAFLLKHGYQPSLQDIAREFGFADRNGAYGHIKALEAKGWFERREGEVRALTILLQPDGTPFHGLDFLPAPNPETSPCQQPSPASQSL